MKMKYNYKFEICDKPFYLVTPFYLDFYIDIMFYSIAFFMGNVRYVLFEPCKMFDKKELQQNFEKNNKHWTYEFKNEIIKNIFNSKKSIIREFGL